MAKETSKEEEKIDEEILFPEKVVKGIVVKPWSFGVLFEITEDLEMILSKLDEVGVDIDTMLASGITWTNMMKVFTVAAPHILRIIMLTTKEDEVTIKELSMSVGIEIALLIYAQNRDQIKNALSPQAV